MDCQQLQQQQPQNIQKPLPSHQQQQEPQQSTQHHLVGNVNSIDTSFMDNLPVNFPSVSPKGMNVNQNNYYRHSVDRGGQNVVYDGLSSTNQLPKNGYSSHTSANHNNGTHYGNQYQNDGINYHHWTHSNNSNFNDYTDGGRKYSMASVHPFAGLLNKANLKICGDLMEMTFQWSASEWQSGRRLVRFWRRQNTNNVENSQQVECRFQPIEFYAHHQEQQQQQHQNVHLNSHASDRQNGPMTTAQASPHSPISPLRPCNSNEISNNNTTITTSSLVVSCIYWREQNDYFITSVDCIYLLEGLIGVQFTVEEKNRIRRNLEGFRPLTVSKCKTDCADFFKMIMGFPHPKPRNIEKDVKVFAWKVLPQALRKIIRKYTPNYTNLPSSSSSSSSSSASSLSMPPNLSSTSVGHSAPFGNPSPTSVSSHISSTTLGQQQQQQQHQQQHHRNPLQQRQYCY
ncbi:unnamed protein product [Absidia cylindrospora]